MSAIVRRLAAGALFSVLLPGSRVDAQGSGAAPRPGWQARDVNTSLPGVGPADVRIAMNRLEQIEKLLLQIPEIARPRGFEIFAKYSVGGRILHPDETQRETDVVAYSIELMFAVPTWEIAGEGADCISFRMNTPNAWVGSTWQDEQGRQIYIEPFRGKPMSLATQVWGSYAESPVDYKELHVLLTSGGEIPWRQLTRNEYYESLIFDDQGKGGAKIAAYRKQLQTTPYQEWLAGAAKRKQERDELFKTLAGSVPAAELAKMRKDAEDNEREIGENLKRSEADDRAANQKALALSSWVADSINAERRKQSAAELRLPALIDAQGERMMASGRSLADRDGPTVWRVVTHNYDFFRARRSRVEVRSIQMDLLASGTCSNPAVKRAVFAAYQKMDWAAFNRMLDVPR